MTRIYAAILFVSLGRFVAPSAVRAVHRGADAADRVSDQAARVVAESLAHGDPPDDWAGAVEKVDDIAVGVVGCVVEYIEKGQSQ